jgi:hypothetical protein
MFAAGNLNGSGLTLDICKGTDAQLLQSIGEAKLALCRDATAEGLRYSIRALTTIFAAGGVFYLWASRTMDKDMIARMN